MAATLFKPFAVLAIPLATVSDKRRLYRMYHDELVRIVLLVALCLLVGFMSGYPVAGVLVALFWLLLRYAHVINVLARWLLSGKEPDSTSQHIIHLLVNRIRSSLNQLQLRKKQTAMLARGFRDLLRALPDAIVVIDKNLRIEWFTDKASTLLPLQRGDAGNSITGLVRKPDFVQFLQDNDYSATPVIRVGSEPVRYLRVHRIRYTEHSDLLVFRDITRMYALQQRQASFIANASHELNTPLTVIRGYTELAQKNVKSNSEAYEYLDKSVAEIDRLSELTRDLLTLSQLNQSSTQHLHKTLYPAQVITQVVDKIRQIPAYSKRDIQLQLTEKLTMSAIEVELETIFHNLIDNALKYSSKDSAVTVTWDTNKAGTRVFAVADSGIGIDKRFISRLTDQFYRVPMGDDPGGTGLGLSIVAALLERYNGELKIDSMPGKGSVFRCLFIMNEDANA